MSAVPTVSQHALAWLREAIAGGDLRPGDRVRQEDVAERIGVSVAPVREALRALEQEGQVTYLPRRGYAVTELRIADLEEIYELRATLEALALRRALPRLTPEGLARLEEAAAGCATAAEAGDVAAELAANRAFHLGLLDAADHPHTTRLIRQLWDATEAYRAMYYNSPDERRASLAAHEAILAGVRDGDPEATITAMDAHRDAAIAFLRGLLAPAAGA